ncbi:MAG: DUF932 domain-containing protein [Solirubrobacteraceae bacterium]
MHDGSTAVIAATTPIRVICQNTLYADVRIDRVIRISVLSELS